jgi:hypothetical protein
VITRDLIAFFAQLVRKNGSVGIKLGTHHPTTTSAPATIKETPASLRDIHNIIHHGAGPAPKVIERVEAEVSSIIS